MGWNLPTAWIEVKIRDRYRGVAKPSNIFKLTHERAILLGHAKYGKAPGWEPAKPLRGLPSDLSNEVATEIKSRRSQDPVDITYYSLTELKDIDLEDTIGFAGAKSDEYVERRGIQIILDDGRNQYSYTHIPDIIEDDVKKSLENGPISIDLGRKEVKMNGEDAVFLAPWQELERRTDSDTMYPLDEWKKVEGSLNAKPRRKKYFAPELQNLIEFMEQFKGKKFKWLSVYGPVEEDDIRLVFWSHFGDENLEEELREKRPDLFD